jgi:pyruvate ferredoxin oxidoreductase gamma subunit
VGKDGYILINTGRDLESLGIAELASGRRPERIALVSATDIAMKHIGRPVPNAALLGAFAALTRHITLDAVAAAISETFGDKLARANIAAASAAYAAVTAVQQERVHVEAD